MTDDATPRPVGPGPAPDGSLPEAAAPRDDGDLALLRLIDRLATLLDRSDLTELEVESGGTGLVLRKPDGARRRGSGRGGRRAGSTRADPVPGR